MINNALSINFANFNMSVRVSSHLNWILSLSDVILVTDQLASCILDHNRQK